MHQVLMVLLRADTAGAVVPATGTARVIQQDLGAPQRYWKTDICRGQWRKAKEWWPR